MERASFCGPRADIDLPRACAPFEWDGGDGICSQRDFVIRLRPASREIGQADSEFVRLAVAERDELVVNGREYFLATEPVRGHVRAIEVLMLMQIGEVLICQRERATAPRGEVGRHPVVLGTVRGDLHGRDFNDGVACRRVRGRWGRA